MVPSLVMLRWNTATKVFLLGLLFAVMLCFVGGKWASQGANEIHKIFGQGSVPISSK